MTTTGPALATRDLACGIGRRTVLTGIDLEVRRGEVLGLIGANGTGKSTLFAGSRRGAGADGRRGPARR